jgi:hypothetical protein
MGNQQRNNWRHETTEKYVGEHYETTQNLGTFMGLAII